MFIMLHNVNHTQTKLVHKCFVGVVMAVIAWYVDLQLPMESVPIATDVVSSNFRSARGIQHYVIKVASDLRSSDFLHQ